jgi:hypothetical protein
LALQKQLIIIIIIIIIGTTALSEPRPSLEASASCPYSLQHSLGSPAIASLDFATIFFFRSRLSALLPTPRNPGGPIGLLLSLGLHHGPRETATTRNFVLWLFLNNHNALWH